MAVIEAIATTYLEADAASVTFSSLGSYEHLQIRVSGRHTSAGGVGSNMHIRLNGDTGSNYSSKAMAGGGSSASTTRFASYSTIYSGGYVSGPLTPAEGYATTIIDILDYRNSNKNTTMEITCGLANDPAGTPLMQFGSALWDNTAAVTTILLYPSSGSFARGSEFTLYGLKSS
jgi:hypothetical protein